MRALVPSLVVGAVAEAYLGVLLPLNLLGKLFYLVGDARNLQSKAIYGRLSEQLLSKCNHRTEQGTYVVELRETKIAGS